MQAFTTLDEFQKLFNNCSDTQRLHALTNKLSHILTEESTPQTISFFLRHIVNSNKQKALVSLCALSYLATSHTFFTPQLIQKNAIIILQNTSSKMQKLNKTLAACGICFVLENLNQNCAEFLQNFAQKFHLNLICEFQIFKIFEKFPHLGNDEVCQNVFLSEGMKNLYRNFGKEEGEEFGQILLESLAVDEHYFVKMQVLQKFEQLDDEFIKNAFSVVRNDEKCSLVVNLVISLLEREELKVKMISNLQNVLELSFFTDVVGKLLGKSDRSDMEVIERLIQVISTSQCQQYKEKLIEIVSADSNFLGNKIIYQFVPFVNAENLSLVVKNLEVGIKNISTYEQLINAIGFLSQIVKVDDKILINVFIGVVNNLTAEGVKSEFNIEMDNLVKTDEQKNTILSKFYLSVVHSKKLVQDISEIIMKQFSEGLFKKSKNISSFYKIIHSSCQLLNQVKQVKDEQLKEVLDILQELSYFLTLISLFQVSDWTPILKLYSQLVFTFSENLTPSEESMTIIGEKVVAFINSFVAQQSRILVNFNIQIFKQFLPIFDMQIISQICSKVNVDNLIRSQQEDQIDEGDDNEVEEAEEDNESEEQQQEVSDNESVKSLSEDAYDQALASLVLNVKEQARQHHQPHQIVLKSMELLKTFIDQQPDSPLIYMALQSMLDFITHPLGNELKLQKYDKHALDASVKKALNILDSTLSNKKIKSIVNAEELYNEEKQLDLMPWVTQLLTYVKERHQYTPQALAILKLISFAIVNIDNIELKDQKEKDIKHILDEIVQLVVLEKVVLTKEYFVEFYSQNFVNYHDFITKSLIKSLSDLKSIKAGILSIGILQQLFTIRSNEIKQEDKILLLEAVVMFAGTEAKSQFEQDFIGKDRHFQLTLVKQLLNDLCKFLISTGKRMPITMIRSNSVVAASQQFCKNCNVKNTQDVNICLEKIVEITK